MDLIGKIHVPSFRSHYFIVVAINYFTTWVDAVPAKAVNQAYIIKFINKHIIYTFCLPESITADQGSVFIGEKVKAFADSRGIKILKSTPYFTQGNGQAKSSNKMIKGIVEKMVEDHPRKWHDLLSEALWAY